MKRTRFLATRSLITIGLLACTGLAVAATTDNYAESFESYTEGDTASNLTAVAGSAWTAAETNSVIVSTNYTYNYMGLDYPIPAASHALVLNVQNGVTNTINAGTIALTNWLDVVINPVFFDGVPEIPAAGTVAAVYFNTNGNPVVMHTPTNTAYAEWVTISNRTVSKDDWIRLTIVADFQTLLSPPAAQPTRLYKVYINEVALSNEVAYIGPQRSTTKNGSWFGNRRARTETDPFTNVIVKGTGYIDDLVVTSNQIVFAEREATYIEFVNVSNTLFYGQTLADAGVYGTATNAAGSNVVGQITFVNPAIVPNAGTTNYAVIFTPDDSGASLTAYGMVEVVTLASQPAIETLPTTSELTDGQTLADVVLGSGMVTNIYNGAAVDGDFAFVADLTNRPPVGTTPWDVVFTPSNAVNYVTVTGSVDVVVVGAGGVDDPPTTWLDDTGITLGDLDTPIRADGMTPRQAWLASTDPTNTAFSFKVTDVRNANGTNYVEWVSVFVDTNLPPYGIWARTNLMDPNYDLIDTYPRTAGATPETPVTNIWWEPAPGTPKFYRVVATNTPSGL